MELLGGTDRRAVLKMGEGEVDNGVGGQEIEREEFIEQLRKLKKGKAPGQDGIENEAWVYMERGIGEGFLALMRGIWRYGGIPRDWNTGAISPIFKKGNKEEIVNYRGITLMSTAYKVYAGALNKKLTEEVEGKLPQSQFGFRKNRGVVDAVYILNYVVNKELSKGGKMFAFFADLKAAFDTVDRTIMNEMMIKAGTSEQLRRRVMETYEETRNVVKVGDAYSEEFWTERGMRQGCPLSPTLFNVYVMDLEEEMRKGQAGGVVVGKEKFWTIVYADDVVLLARSETELRDMINRFRKFLVGKRLRLSPEKSKVMVFERGRGRGRNWSWGKETLEEVKEIRYLGFIVQKNEGTEKHIKERIKKATIAMKSAWSIGERIFKEDFGKRMRSLEGLAGSVALFGAEILL